MRTRTLTVVAIAAIFGVAAGAALFYAPRSGATPQKASIRKGPRALPLVRSEVAGVTIEDPRFEHGDDSLVIFDVVNRTQAPIREFVVTLGHSRDGFVSYSPEYDVAPGARIVRHTPTDNIPDGGELVLSAALFADGAEAGTEEGRAAMKRFHEGERDHLKARPEPPAHKQL